MKKTNVINVKGENVKELKLNETIFGIEPNDIVLKKAIRLQLDSLRQGTAKTKNRSEVSGGGRKPYRQKGTGNARQGTTKGPQFTGGGIVFAPKPRDFSTKINQKKKSAAFVSAISAKLADKELLVIKDLKLKESKTKLVADMIEKLKLENQSVMFVNPYDVEFIRAVQNIPQAEVTTGEQLSVMDIVNHRTLIVSVDAIKTIEKQYGGVK